MTNLQKLTIRASEIRQRLNECASLTGDALTTEIRSEVDTLTTEYADTETKLRAAIVADDGTQHRGAADDAEARELAELTGRASLGRILAGVVEHRQADGAEAELQSHLRMPSNVIPLDLLRAPAGEVEARAVTPTPASGAAMQEQPIPPVFAMGAGAFLGIDRPTVAYGSAVYPGAHDFVAHGRRAACRQFGRGRHDRRFQRDPAGAPAATGVVHLPALGCGRVRGHGFVPSHGPVDGA